MWVALGSMVLAAILLGPMDLEARDTAVMITYFADNAGRLQVHGLGVALGKLLLLGGFVALYTSLRNSGWARMGLAAWLSVGLMLNYATGCPNGRGLRRPLSL
jgi:hypothetical protein